MVQQNTQLDKYLMPQNSPISAGSLPPTQVPWEYGIRQKLQGKQFKFSSMVLKNFIQNSQVTSGTFAANNNVITSLTTTIANNIPHQADPVLSIPHIGIYLGTAQVAGSQIYPGVGTGIATGSYSAWGGFDYQPYDGTKTNFTVSIVNSSGAAGTFYYAIQHKYITYNRGTAS